MTSDADPVAASPAEGAGRAGPMTALVQVVLGALAGTALFAMMVLTFVDVIGRKLLAHSVTGGVELTELLMLVLIFCALPLASLAGQHVVFDVLDGVLPERVRRWQSTLSNLIAAGLVGAAAWFVLSRAGRSLDMGDTTAQLLLPIAPFQFAAAGLLGLCALMHLYVALSGRTRA